MTWTTCGASSTSVKREQLFELVEVQQEVVEADVAAREAVDAHAVAPALSLRLEDAGATGPTGQDRDVVVAPLELAGERLGVALHAPDAVGGKAVADEQHPHDQARTAPARVASIRDNRQARSRPAAVVIHPDPVADDLCRPANRRRRTASVSSSPPRAGGNPRPGTSSRRATSAWISGTTSPSSIVRPTIARFAIPSSTFRRRISSGPYACEWSTTEAGSCTISPPRLEHVLRPRHVLPDRHGLAERVGAPRAERPDRAADCVEVDEQPALGLGKPPEGLHVLEPADGPLA